MCNSNETKPLPSLLTVKLFAAKHPAFTVPILRDWIFDRNKNGFDECIIRVGNKILIDEAKMFDWIYKQDGKWKKADRTLKRSA